MTHAGRKIDTDREKETKKKAGALSLLADFLAVRDLESLNKDCLRRKFGIERADVLVLFGGSILSGADLMAGAMDEGLASCYAIAGGFGHTTPAFHDNLLKLYPSLKAAGNSEAELFDAYLHEKYGKKADILETESTNCGYNITYLLKILRERNIPCRTMILIHDASMERRIGATLARHAPEVQPIHFAAYRTGLRAEGETIVYRHPGADMYEMDHFISLLLSEIPRLLDDEDGYGPRGRDFIAHVDVPEDVKEAYLYLKEEYGGMIR